MSTAKRLLACFLTIILEEKLQRFEFPTLDSQKPEIQRFCVLVHFEDNRFALEKSPPP